MSFPCIDPATRRYTPFPCGECKAPVCWTGRKPRPAATAEQVYCPVCDTPFEPAPNQRYCGEECRAEGRRRKAERLSDIDVYVVGTLSAEDE